MTVLINDPDLARRFRAEREASDASHHDEVWDGVYVVSPNPNNIHQLSYFNSLPYSPQSLTWLWVIRFCPVSM